MLCGTAKMLLILKKKKKERNHILKSSHWAPNPRRPQFSKRCVRFDKAFPDLGKYSLLICYVLFLLDQFKLFLFIKILFLKYYFTAEVKSETLPFLYDIDSLFLPLENGLLIGCLYSGVNI